MAQNGLLFVALVHSRSHPITKEFYHSSSKTVRVVFFFGVVATDKSRALRMPCHRVTKPHAPRSIISIRHHRVEYEVPYC